MRSEESEGGVAFALKEVSVCIVHRWESATYCETFLKVGCWENWDALWGLATEPLWLIRNRGWRRQKTDRGEPVFASDTRLFLLCREQLVSLLSRLADGQAVLERCLKIRPSLYLRAYHGDLVPRSLLASREQ